MVYCIATIQEELVVGIAKVRSRRGRLVVIFCLLGHLGDKDVAVEQLVGYGRASLDGDFEGQDD